MLIATHEMGFARDVANEVWFLHDGRILERGKPAELLPDPQRPETPRFLNRLRGCPQSDSVRSRDPANGEGSACPG